jgi:hypothetical protein
VATSTGIPQGFLSLPKPAGTTYVVSGLVSNATAKTTTFTTSSPHNFVVGDSVYFPTGHFESSNSVPWGGYKVVGVPSTTTLVVYNSSATTFTATLTAGVPYRLAEGMRSEKKYVFTNYHVAVGGGTRVGTQVTLVLTGNAIVGSNNFVVGDVVYITSSDANYPSGFKTITGRNTSAISYQESGTGVASTAVISVSLNSVLTPNFAGVAAGDILSKDGSYRKLATVASGVLEVNKDSGEGQYNLNPLTGADPLVKAESTFLFYANTPTSAATIVAWVNANAKDSLGNQRLTGTLVPHNGGGSNDGTANISVATDEEFFDTTNNASFDGAGNRSVKAFPLFGGSH